MFWFFLRVPSDQNMDLSTIACVSLPLIPGPLSNKLKHKKRLHNCKENEFNNNSPGQRVAVYQNVLSKQWPMYNNSLFQSTFKGCC